MPLLAGGLPRIGKAIVFGAWPLDLSRAGPLIGMHDCYVTIYACLLVSLVLSLALLQPLVLWYAAGCRLVYGAVTTQVLITCSCQC
jgi:hypothetical protein